MKRFKAYSFAKLILTVLCTFFIICSFAYAQEDKMGKTLILYYSLTGNTGAGCEALQKALGADILEIKDLKKRSDKGFTYRRTGFASLFGLRTRIEPENPDLSAYHNIIIGSPIWTGKLSMAIRTLIDKNSFDGKKVVIYTTTNAGEKGKYKEKSSNLVREAGGDVVGYYQILAMDRTGDEKVKRTNDQIIADTLMLVPSIKENFSLKK